MEAVKLEGADSGRLRTVEVLVRGGIAVMGHIGLTPQSYSTLGGFRAQGRHARQAVELVAQAKRLESAGIYMCPHTTQVYMCPHPSQLCVLKLLRYICVLILLRCLYVLILLRCICVLILVESAGVFAMVLECVPEEVAKEVTAAVSVPTIGIGAGPHTSGQVLVYHDLLGMMQHPHYAKVVQK